MANSFKLRITFLVIDNLSFRNCFVICLGSELGNICADLLISSLAWKQIYDGLICPLRMVLFILWLHVFEFFISIYLVDRESILPPELGKERVYIDDVFESVVRNIAACLQYKLLPYFESKLVVLSKIKFMLTYCSCTKRFLNKNIYITWFHDFYTYQGTSSASRSKWLYWLYSSRS